MAEIKFIIVKDNQGQVRHLKSTWLHHYTIARDNGYNVNQILECGLFLDGNLFILECQSQEHILKHSRQYVGNALNAYQDLRLTSWLKGRELESQLYYNKRPVGLREGD
jgi:hypothetical protein